MAKKFKAVNRISGETWKPQKIYAGKQYLMLYDSGYAAVVTEDFYIMVTPLNPKEWEVVFRDEKKGGGE